MRRVELTEARWPRGLSRVEAAAYVGVCETTFDKLLRERRMPAPKRIGRRKVWDRLGLDAAFAALPTEGGASEPPGDESDAWEDVAA